MRRFLPYILIVFTLVNFLAPVSIGLSEKNRVVVEKNMARAADPCIIKNFSFSPKGGPNEAFPDFVSLNLGTENCVGKQLVIALYELSGVDETVYNVSRDNNYKLLENDFVINITPTEKSCADGKCRIEFYVALYDITSGIMSDDYSSKDADVEKELDYNCKTNTCKDNDTNWTKSDSNTGFQAETATIWRGFTQTTTSIIVSGGEQVNGPLKITKDKIDPQDSVSIAIYNDDGTPVSKEILGENNPVVIGSNLFFDSNNTFSYKKEFTGLTPQTFYTISIIPNFKNYPYLNIENKTEKVPTRNKEGTLVDPTPGKTTSDSQEIILPATDAETMPECGLGIFSNNATVGGCFAQLIYYALFVPTSYMFALAGNFFDWTFAYSVNDASYRSGFVVQGWGVVRDFCNMFFIFVLLYVAFTTILGTQDAKTKEMIVHVVLIGLLINFSLFATQVIIDASNILARVFYNSNTIVITPNGSTVGQTGLNTTPSDTGIIPLSEALVNKINPQNLIINANDVGDFDKESNIGVAKKAATKESLTAGRFIIVTLLAVAVNIVGFVVFITVALLFVGRVVMLWIAMILSPAVFFTYMVPKLKDMEMIGWTKWWPETISLAFLAPVFIFFLYLILKFLETKIVFIDSTGKTGIQMVIAVMVPFVFIMILLLKAKKIATQLAGEMGKTMAKAGSAVSGLALGAATGGAALAMRGTLGKYAGSVANDEELKAKAKAGSWSAKMKLRAANYGSKASYDARNTVVGKAAEKELGVDLNKQASWVGLGTKKTAGGYVGGLERGAKRDAKDSENLKLSVSAGADQDERAKKWNDGYNIDLAEKKTAWETAHPGKIFNEGQHKRDYEKANGAKVRTSDEENKQRFADKASEIEYGAGYLEKRDKAKDDARKDAKKSFNEGAWRKTENINKRTNLDDRENLVVKDLRSKSNPEKPPLNASEKSNADKAIIKAQTAYDNAHTEIERVETKLQDIAGPGKSTENLSKTNIDKYIATNHTPKLMTANAEISQLTALMNSGNVSNAEIIKADAEVTRLTALMNTHPGNPNLQNDLATAQMNRKLEVDKEIVDTKNNLIAQNLIKKGLDDEIRDLNSMLSNRINQQSIKVQQSSIIKEKNDDLARG